MYDSDKIFSSLRIMLHIAFVAVLILLFTQKLWVDPLVNYIVEHFDVLPAYPLFIPENPKA